MKDILIGERFRVDVKISQGGHSVVYRGTDLESGDKVAIKIEWHAGGCGLLRDEAEVLKTLSGGRGMPYFVWAGVEAECDVLVLKLLGPSLDDLFQYCGGTTLSLKTVLLLADQLLHRLEYIHSKGWIHRDIKPGNMLMGLGKAGSAVHLVDFGMITKHRPIQTRQVAIGLAGTMIYASINAHNKLEQSRLDDLESLGYVLIEFASGSLPWRHFVANEAEIQGKVKDMKLDIDRLCHGLPAEFEMYMRFVKSSGFAQRPDYAYLRRLFSRLFIRKGFKYDNIFDWTIKRFVELHDLSEWEELLDTKPS